MDVPSRLRCVRRAFHRPGCGDQRASFRAAGVTPPHLVHGASHWLSPTVSRQQLRRNIGTRSPISWVGLPDPSEMCPRLR
jgi:hypothetical protein